MTSRFVPLHLHSETSFLDALSKPKELAARAKELGYPAIGLTDHGNVHNFVRVYQACKAEGVKFIPGCEFYFTHRHKNKEKHSYHLTILARNNKGLSNLYKMLTWANIPVEQGGGFYGKPRASWKELKKYREGLICLTGCMNSPVNRAFLEQGYKAGLRVAERLHEIFGDNLYVELQYVKEIKEHEKLLKMGRRLAEDLGVEAVATNDCHYVLVGDKETHDVLKGISRSPGYSGNEYYMKSEEEMLEVFSEEEVFASGKIAESCDVKIPLKKDHMPRFSQELTREQTFDKLVEEVKKGWKFWKIGKKKNSKEYQKRLKMELKDIKEANLQDYFMLVWDVMKFVDDNDIGRGFSRGSAGGSLVSFLLKITLVDPIEHGLIWERFWNRGRRGSMPDIDCDIDPYRRDEVIEYLKNKFGRNKVFPMMTISTMAAKVVIKDAGRAIGLPFDYLNKLTKKFPKHAKTLADALEQSQEMAKIASGEDHEVEHWNNEIEKLKNRWEKSKKKTGERDFRIEGQIVDLQSKIAERSRKLIKTFKVAANLEKRARQRSKHPCALLISDKPIFGRVPLTWDTKHKSLITGFDMYDVEKLGYLKLDMLGVANTAAVSRVLPRGAYEVLDIGFDDKKAYKVMGRGATKGVFQFEKRLGVEWCRKMRPKNLEEVAALSALLRPGPLTTGLSDKYLKNRREGKWDYIHPDLEPIFRETYGVMVFQEQMLEVVKKFAGFDLAQADVVRKACGKKLPEEMAKQKKGFVEGCLENGYEQELAEQLWEWIEAQAGYSFNKCISGKATLDRGSSGRSGGRNPTLEHLYRTFNDLEYAKKNRCVSLRKKIRRIGYGSCLALDGDGRIRPRKIKDIVYSGLKQTFKIKLSNGKEVTATGDHKFFTSDGFVRVKDFRIGVTKLVCDGGYEQTNFARSNAFSNEDSLWKSRPYAKPRCGFPSGPDNPAYTDGSYTNFKNAKAALSEIDYCQRCGNTGVKLQHNHIDGDRTNSSIENVEKLCDSCHKKADYEIGKRKKRWEKGHCTEEAVVEAILPYGIEETYDVEMDTAEHNFLANGIVSSNSHAVGYGMMTYATAYLKARRPVEFFNVMLQLSSFGNSKPKDEISELFYDAKLFNVDIKGPKLKLGNADFEVRNNNVYFGLKHIRDIGDSAIENLVKFKDSSWVEILHHRKELKRPVLKALIYSGAVDHFGMPRKQLELSVEFVDSLTPRENSILKSLLLTGEPVELNHGKVVDLGKAPSFRAAVSRLAGFLKGDNIQLKAISSNRAERLLDVCEEYLSIDESEDITLRAKAGFEIYYLGIPATCSEVDIYNDSGKTHDCIEIKKEYDDVAATTVALIGDVSIKNDKRGKNMAWVKFSDKTYLLEGLMFSDAVEKCRDQLVAGRVARISGVKRRGTFIIESARII